MFDKEPFPSYKPRRVLYGDMTVPMWSGVIVIALFLAIAIFCLLTHRIPL